MAPKLPKSLQTLLDKLRAAIALIMRDMETGELTKVKWRDAMKALMMRFISASFMTGQESPLVGVTEQGYIYDYVKAQLGFIDNFYLSIVSSPEFQEGWKTRAESYANGIVAPYWKGKTKMLPLPAMPGDMTTPCGQLCACLWDIKTIDEDNNDYDCYWVLNASRIVETEHCQTCEQRSIEWNPIKVRDGRLIIPQGEAGKEYIEHIQAHILEAVNATR